MYVSSQSVWRNKIQKLSGLTTYARAAARLHNGAAAMTLALKTPIAINSPRAGATSEATSVDLLRACGKIGVGTLERYHGCGLLKNSFAKLVSNRASFELSNRNATT